MTEEIRKTKPEEETEDTAKAAGIPEEGELDDDDVSKVAGGIPLVLMDI